MTSIREQWRQTFAPGQFIWGLACGFFLVATILSTFGIWEPPAKSVDPLLGFALMWAARANYYLAKNKLGTPGVLP